MKMPKMDKDAGMSKKQSMMDMKDDKKKGIKPGSKRDIAHDRKYIAASKKGK